MQTGLKSGQGRGGGGGGGGEGGGGVVGGGWVEKKIMKKVIKSKKVKKKRWRHPSEEKERKFSSFFPIFPIWGFFTPPYCCYYYCLSLSLSLSRLACGSPLRNLLPNQQRTLSKLPTELRCRNSVNKHRPSIQMGAKRAKTCVQCVHIPTELPLVVG